MSHQRGRSVCSWSFRRTSIAKQTNLWRRTTHHPQIWTWCLKTSPCRWRPECRTLQCQRPQQQFFCRSFAFRAQLICPVCDWSHWPLYSAFRLYPVYPFHFDQWTVFGCHRPGSHPDLQLYYDSCAQFWCNALANYC